MAVADVEEGIYGHVGIYLGNGMVANNRGYFSVESLEEWCSWQTATVRDMGGSVMFRWSSGKLEQKERMKRMRTYRVMKKKGIKCREKESEL